MLKLTILLTLLSFSASANSACPPDKKEQCDTEDYANCIARYPCDLDGKSLHHLPKKEREIILQCRLKRHMKCVQPEETMTLDPVYEYYKIYGEYLHD